MNSKVPKSPMIFLKPESALNSQSELKYPTFTSNLHYELELVLKINRRAQNIAQAEAGNYYQEIGLGIDFTARDIQAECKVKGHPWEKAKAFDNSASLGGMVNKSDLNLNEIEFTLKHNDHVVQNGNSKNMIFNFDHIVAYSSQFFTLNPGDLVFTGTPAGVGPVKPGSKLEGYLDGKSLLKVSII